MCVVPVQGDHIACIDHWKQVGEKAREQVQLRIHAWNDRNAAEAYLVGFFRQQMHLQEGGR
jgi:hypothetical protein